MLLLQLLLLLLLLPLVVVLLVVVLLLQAGACARKGHCVAGREPQGTCAPARAGALARGSRGDSGTS